jgi:TPR repeat protein
VYSFSKTGNNGKCPFCNSDHNKTAEDVLQEVLKRVEANDAGAVCALGNSYNMGLNGIQQDRAKAKELLTKSADLGYSKAHNNLGVIYEGAGNLKKAKFHVEAAAMAGDEVARCNLGIVEGNSGNMERAIKHLRIAASGGEYRAMHYLRNAFENGHASKESIDTALAAYNNSCAEMRSEARDAYIRFRTEST